LIAAESLIEQMIWGKTTGKTKKTGRMCSSLKIWFFGEK
jgi:hypothetical protein